MKNRIIGVLFIMLGISLFGGLGYVVQIEGFIDKRYALMIFAGFYISIIISLTIGFVYLSGFND